MEDLKVKLETAYKASGGRKVNIISHSMGGLLVKCFMSLHHEVFILSLHDLVKFIIKFHVICAKDIDGSSQKSHNH